MDKKIPYDKKIKKNKRRQVMAFERGAATLGVPPLDAKELKRLLLEQKREEGPIDLDGIGLTYMEAEKKIRQAVEATIEEERKKYEGSLQDLNNQLNAAKTKISMLEETLIITPHTEDQMKEKNAEIDKLKIGLIRIETRLQVKEELLDKNYTRAIEELRAVILELSGKLSEGQVNTLIKTIERPEIQDDIFIDPIEGGDELDPHIKIKAEDTSTTVTGRNVKDDLAKLKDLLGKRGS